MLSRRWYNRVQSHVFSLVAFILYSTLIFLLVALHFKNKNKVFFVGVHQWQQCSINMVWDRALAFLLQYITKNLCIFRNKLSYHFPQMDRVFRNIIQSGVFNNKVIHRAFFFLCRVISILVENDDFIESFFHLSWKKYCFPLIFRRVLRVSEKY